MLQLCHREVSNNRAPLHPTEQKAEPTLKMHASLKYHCELACEGVEFSWPFMKRNYQTNEKKEKFNKAVRSSVELVSVQNLRIFVGWCRHCMVTYLNFEKGDQQNMTLDMIKKYTCQIKTRRNVADIEKAGVKQSVRKKILLCIFLWWPETQLYIIIRKSTYVYPIYKSNSVTCVSIRVSVCLNVTTYPRYT